MLETRKIKYPTAKGGDKNSDGKIVEEGGSGVCRLPAYEPCGYGEDELDEHGVAKHEHKTNVFGDDVPGGRHARLNVEVVDDVSQVEQLGKKHSV